MVSTTLEADVVPPAPVDVDEMAGSGDATAAADAAVAAVEEVEPVHPARGLYLVRVPKPPVDESGTKQQQAEVQAYIAKLKALNPLLTSKRDEVRGFRRQMAEARGLKETSEPEYQDKLGRIKQLRDLRQGYVGRIQEVKASLQGLDCKSEAELEDKIKQLEHRIAHEGMPLREEKQLVQQIAKLNAQRPRMREYETHKASLAEMESESSKIKAIITDMDDEFSVIKSERDTANNIVKDIWTKLQKAGNELKELEAEQADLAAAKDLAMKALDDMREDSNSSMRDYRENRRFSLQVRDMVAAGQVEEAQALVAAQVDDWCHKLSGDSALRTEYQQLWAGQRKYMVSELLPGSSLIAQEEAKAAAKASKGHDKANGAGRPAPGPPRGAEKAKLLIESLMQQASQEAAAVRSRAPQNADDDDDREEAVPIKSAAAAPAGKKVEAYKPPSAAAPSPAQPSATPSRLVADDAAATAAAAAAFNFKVELPRVPEMEFVLPVVKSADPVVDEASRQKALREEQRKLAAEAEERKKKKVEMAERKKQQAVEAVKRQEAERKEKEAAAKVAAASAKAAAAAAAVAAKQAADEAAEQAAADAAAASSSGVLGVQSTKQGAPTQWEKSRMLAAAKRPKAKVALPLLKQLQKVWQEYMGWILLALTLIVCVVLAVLSSIYGQGLLCKHVPHMSYNNWKIIPAS